MKSFAIGMALAAVANMVAADSIRIVYPEQNSTFTTGTKVMLAYQVDLTNPNQNTTAALTQADMVITKLGDVLPSNNNGSYYKKLGYTTKNQWAAAPSYVHNTTFIPTIPGKYHIEAVGNATWACGSTLSKKCHATIFHGVDINVVAAPSVTTAKQFAETAAAQPSVSTKTVTVVVTQSPKAKASVKRQTADSEAGNATAIADASGNTTTIANSTTSNAGANSAAQFLAGYSLGMQMMTDLETVFNAVASNASIANATTGAANATAITSTHENFGLLDGLLGGLLGGVTGGSSSTGTDPSCQGLLSSLLCLLLGSNPLSSLTNALGGITGAASGATGVASGLTGAASGLTGAASGVTGALPTGALPTGALPSLPAAYSTTNNFASDFVKFWSDSDRRGAMIGSMASDLSKANVDIQVLEGIEAAIDAWMAQQKTMNIASSNATAPDVSSSATTDALPTDGAAVTDGAATTDAVASSVSSPNKIALSKTGFGYDFTVYHGPGADSARQPALKPIQLQRRRERQARREKSRSLYQFNKQ